ncbi:MAG: amidohydrolase family protein [Verrucomicrobiota bacterium]
MQRIIDIHTHVFPHYADLAVAAMDRSGIEASVVLAWHDGFGDGLQRHIDAFAKYPGRFITFGNVDFSRINEPDFGKTAAAQMERDFATGMRGLKVFKALGLGYRRPDGRYWRPSDPELDPIWAKAGELGIPVLIHSADPPNFWEPVNEFNFWNGVLYGEYSWWTYYNTGQPSANELLGDRIEMVARHRGTTFIFPHCAEKADSLDCAAEDLDAHPNIVYDFSARVPELARSARRAAHTREFFTAYADRIFFGTDVIFDDTNVPTGQQAQILYQPGEIPLNGADPRERYIETTAAFNISNIEFITSSKVQTSPPFKRSIAPFQIHGLGLPEDIAAKILHQNAVRLLGL